MAIGTRRRSRYARPATEGAWLEAGKGGASTQRGVSTPLGCHPVTAPPRHCRKWPEGRARCAGACPCGQKARPGVRGRVFMGRRRGRVREVLK